MNNLFFIIIIYFFNPLWILVYYPSLKINKVSNHVYEK